MEVPGTFRGVVVMAPCDRRGFGDDVERCMWCACPFGSTSGDDDMRRMAAMCTAESGDDLWEGDYIHGICDYSRHQATERARAAARAAACAEAGEAARVVTGAVASCAYVEERNVRGNQHVHSMVVVNGQRIACGSKGYKGYESDRVEHAGH